MYKKFLVVGSKKDLAGMNIMLQLSQFRKNQLLSIGKFPAGFDSYIIEDEILDEKNLDYEKIAKYDFIIFASKHTSEKGTKSLSIHAPGNWKKAELGGKPGFVCRTSALFQKQLFERLNENVSLYGMKDYSITLEATHHGPYIEKPCLFVEIGSSEVEWKDNRAGFIIAKTIYEAIIHFENNPYREIAFGIGGPHYCPAFNEIQEKSNIAISHIIPQYILPITEQIIREAIKKTEEEIDLCILDWNGIGNIDERNRIISILDKNYIRWKKTSDVKKEI